MKNALILAAGIVLASASANAALGGLAETVTQDSKHMKASLRSVELTRYTVHQLQTENGVSVSEYVGHDGVVFAVDWQGPFRPDLRQLLGEHFAAFAPSVDETGRRLGGRRAINRSTEDLEIRSGGHLHAFWGRAWLKSALPQGQLPDEWQASH
jgi:hypothetical protein